MTQTQLTFSDGRETQLERCRRILAGARGNVTTAAKMFDDAEADRLATLHRETEARHAGGMVSRRPPGL